MSYERVFRDEQLHFYGKLNRSTTIHSEIHCHLFFSRQINSKNSESTYVRLCK